MEIKKTDIVSTFGRISDIMNKNRKYLIELDQVNGDGDLGISMSEGFAATYKYMQSSEENDLGKLFRAASVEFNEAAPSSLGTILSIALMGIAKFTKGKESFPAEELGDVLEAGFEAIMEKAGSRIGEKTILDAFAPAIKALKEGKDLKSVALAAAEGSESTKNMRSVHGRAAYYTDKSIGVIDPGSVAGKFIFEAMAE